MRLYAIAHFSEAEDGPTENFRIEVDKDGSILRREDADDIEDLPYEFGGFERMEKNIVEITFPEGVESLKNQLLMECRSLKRVNLPLSLKKIGELCFAMCIQLQNINLHDNIVEIGNGAFSACLSLERVAFPKNAKLGIRVLSETQALRTVTFPETLDEIPLEFFEDSGIQNVSIPEGVRKICESAFRECKELQTARLPKSCKIIEAEAFYQCINLRHIELPENLEHLFECAFQQSGLQSISVPNSCYFIGDGCFRGCESLASLTLPEGLRIIQTALCQNCISLTSILIPKTVKAVLQAAFVETSISVLVFPESVSYVDRVAFAGCNNLKKIYFKRTNIVLHYRSFSSCPNISAVTLHENAKILFTEEKFQVRGEKERDLSPSNSLLQVQDQRERYANSIPAYASLVDQHANISSWVDEMEDELDYFVFIDDTFTRNVKKMHLEEEEIKMKLHVHYMVWAASFPKVYGHVNWNRIPWRNFVRGEYVDRSIPFNFVASAFLTKKPGYKQSKDAIEYESEAIVNTMFDDL